MNFYCIAYKVQNKLIKNFFRKACITNGIFYKDVNLDNFEKIKNIKKTDLFYRISTGANAHIVEKILVNKFQPKTLYCDNHLHIPIQTFDANIVHMTHGIPIAKTYFINTSDRQKLSKIVKMLGGFPIVLKEVDKQKGLGVRKIDNSDDLIRITSKLINEDQHYILREFVDSPGISYRAIVLGNKILVCYKNASVDNSDFRSNVNQEQRNRTLYNLNQLESNILTRAVEELGISFGAVDFAYDKSDHDKMKIFEVNFPCNFMPAQNLSGFDIASEILKYLRNK